MQTVLTVFGTRPEAIKVAPVIAELRKRSDAVSCKVCSTGQHGEILDSVVKLFGIQPDYDLRLMRRDQSLSQLTSRLFRELDAVLLDEKPDWVLAQGDTSTVLVASLVSFYHRCKFGHIEAGLRTHDKKQPFPEEINRRVADLLADLFFAPTQEARQTLLEEGCSADRVLVTGNTSIDALRGVAEFDYDWSDGPLNSIPKDHRIVLVTAHRRESFGNGLEGICKAIHRLSNEYRDNEVCFVYPVHPNPNVRQPVERLLAGLPNVVLLEPLGYVDNVHLMQESQLILTDSGGIQEEAPWLGVPVLVLREKTERPEGIAAGVARLVGTDPERIVHECRRLLDDPNAHRSMATKVNPYGDGQAAQRIVAAILGESLSERPHNLNHSTNV